MTTLSKENYIQKAESVFNDDSRLVKSLTTTQIRNLINLTSRLYDLSKFKTFDELIEDINYLIVQFVYQSGRNESVKHFVNKAKLIQAAKEINDIESLQLFSRYMEALVAYHRYLGGED